MLTTSSGEKVVVWVGVDTVNSFLKMSRLQGLSAACRSALALAAPETWKQRSLRRVGVPFLLIALGGCAAPRPLAPEKVAALRSEPRPDWLQELNVTEAKAKRITAITRRVQHAFVDYDLARIILLEEVVRQIKHGELQRDALLPLAEQMLREFDRGLPVLLVGLNDLHGVLDEAERARLVEMFGGDQRKTPEEREKERQERIQRVLDLSAGQKAELFPALLALALRHWGLVREVEQGVKDARAKFLSEDFDARTLSLVVSRKPMQILAVVYEALEITLPVLTSAQRQTLAAYLEKRLR